MSIWWSDHCVYDEYIVPDIVHFAHINLRRNKIYDGWKDTN